jgi:hypothetical protein
VLMLIYIYMQSLYLQQRAVAVLETQIC